MEWLGVGIAILIIWLLVRGNQNATTGGSSTPITVPLPTVRSLRDVQKDPHLDLSDNGGLFPVGFVMNLEGIIGSNPTNQSRWWSRNVPDMDLNKPEPHPINQSATHTKMLLNNIVWTKYDDRVHVGMVIACKVAWLISQGFVITNKTGKCVVMDGVITSRITGKLMIGYSYRDAVSLLKSEFVCLNANGVYKLKIGETT